MKWTHNMVRLLIMVVFYVGDEAAVGGSSNNNNNTSSSDGNDKKKKGKWKTVSQVMMERGFNVSPQQCEDKFNDLNKRYKRVNDILGKGTACRVVEDQTLLDTMDHLSAKAKDEVRKMINSKHLFFREMCAYHNSCGHGPTPGMGSDRCAIPEVEVKKTCKTRIGNPHHHHPSIVSEDEDDEDDGDGDDNDDGDDHDHDNDNDDEEEDDDDDEVVTKKPRRETSFLIRGLESEMENVLEDVRKSAYEKREWLKVKKGQLEEDMMAIRTQAFEMEKQRLKWLKFSAKKEMEMEKERLANERMKLENERLMLFVRKHELGLIDN